jgi:methyl-accepting chemotaxis protein
MRILGRLLGSVVALVAGQALATWWVLLTVFPFSPGDDAALVAVLVIGATVAAMAVATVTFLLARSMEAALGAGADLDEVRLHVAESAGHGLPLRVSAIVGIATLAVGAAAVTGLRERGLAEDLALAAVAVELATALLAAMLGYVAASSAAARALDALGTRAEIRVAGTVQGKILVVGFGLNTIGVLLFASTGYVQYRADFDRQYVQSVTRAHAAAVADVRKPDPELAEHAFLLSGAPSALISAEGVVVAQFGRSDVSFGRARGRDAVQRLEGGWLVTSPAPGGASLASYLSETPLRERRRGFLFAVLTVALFVYLATALVAYLAARAITTPFRALGRAADRIASGDLTVSPPSVSRDELGRLAADFRRMAQGLKGLVVDVQGASGAVSVGAREAAAIGERVRAGAVDEHAGVVAVQAAVEAMEGSMSRVSQGVGGLSDYVAVTNRAMSEMASAFEEVSKKGDELEHAMEAAIADVDRLARAGTDAETRLGVLEGLASHAGNTLAAVRASMNTLERAAAESETTAELVAEMSERAGGVVEETVHGIESLRAAVADAHRRVSALGRRSDDIDQVVDFISEVAGRTNLLSLNASIIAAQAGEHGKPFGVVADQIRELAAQIARSTKSIGDIIHSVREDVEATAHLIERGDALAVDGVRLARGSLEALSGIRRSTIHARDTAMAIRMAVDAHARSSGEVSKLVESVADGTKAVSAAVQLVGRSVTTVNSVLRGVDAVADQVSRALQDQAGLGKHQIEAVGRLERMIGEIRQAVEVHDAANRRVRDTLQNLARSAEHHESAVDGLAAVADRIGSGARSLAERVDRFKVQ